MQRLAALFVLLLLLGGTEAQEQSKTAPSTNNGGATAASAITANTPPVELARAAFKAQGGEKLRALKNMILRGSVDLYPPNSTFAIPGGFLLVTAGDKVRLEIDARPAISFKQIFDGQQSYGSIPGVEVPPPSKFGLSALAKFDQPGLTVSAIPDKKKLRGFRIADEQGNTTDFYIDPANARVMSFIIPYGNYTFGTEHKKFKEVEGVLVPSSFTQRLEMPQGAFFAEFSVKEIKLNQTFGDEVFAIP